MEPISTSGGLYHNVTTSCEYVRVGTDFALAKPAEKLRYIVKTHVGSYGPNILRKVTY